MRTGRCRGVASFALLATLVGCGAEAPRTDVRGPRHLVIVSLDTFAATHAGAYGYGRDTSPVLGRIAARGVMFEHAYTQQVWTLTAHASLFSGLYPLVHGASEQRPIARAAPLLAERLRAAGFDTAAFTGTRGYMDPHFGLARGFERYEIGQEDAARDNAARIAWLRAQAQRAAEDPSHRFFLFAHYFDPHSDVGSDVPYDAPAPWRERFVPEVPDADHWGRHGDTELLIRMQKEGAPSALDLAMLRAFYDGGLRYTDEVGLGGLLGALEAAGLRDETLLVVTADHGEEIFEHGKVSHQQPYEEIARVPLVFAGPGVAEGLRRPELVELVDVAPTVLALLGVPVPDAMQGRDLSPLLREGGALPAADARVDGVMGGEDGLRVRTPSAITRVVDGRRATYVNTVFGVGEGAERRFEVRRPGRLFLLDEDPDQQHDVAAAHPELARSLERALLDWYARNELRRLQLEAQAGGAPAPPQPLLAPDEARRLEALGYGR